MALLELQDPLVESPAQGATMHAVEGVSLTLDEGDVLGIVGESGSGKSVTMLALMGLVPFPGRVRAARMSFAGRDLPTLSSAERRALTGKAVAMIFQDQTTSLNPCFTIGLQLTETLRLLLGMDRRAAMKRATNLLEQVGIRSATWPPTPASAGCTCAGSASRCGMCCTSTTGCARRWARSTRSRRCTT